MFGGGATNPYDDIVVKTTDENLTSENWELILNLCDKVQDEGEQGSRNVIAAVLKRLAHRNPNVQLYSLALVESLSKNCGQELHHEIASRAFTQTLERLITDRMTHDKVRRRALSLIALWTAEWEKDPTLSLMEECYRNLKAKGYKFDTPDEPPPADVDDEVRRREEEELQRALEISVQDKGGRNQWGQYSLASSSGAGGSGSRAGFQPTAAGSSAGSSSGPADTTPKGPSYSGGYTPASAASTAPTQSRIQTSVPSTPVAAEVTPSTITSTSPTPSVTNSVTRVRALHTFEPSEPGELAFEKGDIIKVVDRGYKDWWRGQLKGRTGIFPVNYVEALPEPTANELAAEAQQEAAVFSQAANVDRLLTMLRSLDPAKDNLADNEEIQELYRSSMALRPKIVKLIDKYSQKRADLMLMNESFVKARTMFDRMMEDSLARHSEYYDQRPPYSQSQPSYQPRPDSRAQPAGYGRPAEPQSYGWNPAVYEQPGYNAYPAPAAAYAPGPDGAGPRSQLQQQQSFSAEPNGAPYAVSATPQQQPAYAAAPQQQPQPQPQTAYVQPYPVQDNRMQYPNQGAPQHEAQHAPVAEAQPQLQPQPQAQQPQSTQQAAAVPLTGPPYAFDPKMTYPDPNVQAWAQYYAQGGLDPTGAVYFFSVPGVKDGASQQQPAAPTDGQHAQAQPQQQPPEAAAGESPQTGYQPYGAYAQGAQQSNAELAPWAGQPQEHGPAAAGAPSSPTQSTRTGAAPFIQAIQTQQQQGLQRQSSLPNPRSPAESPHQLYPETAAGEAWQSPYQALPGQLAGMRVGEQQGPGEQASQGVGA
ncbi:hypothetical protein BV25DRAFT_1894621 [Artomyces pyxidatus]|uniref:Uncharacterized protein n=1 Tax=Artomyces pyxidatus TaxID=48021 RepID=A0ACB8SJE9_9AGAM|nr:hypothetical protein BV25DRAFT_1894621 [Artomyces pyxidatus]